MNQERENYLITLMIKFPDSPMRELKQTAARLHPFLDESEEEETFYSPRYSASLIDKIYKTKPKAFDKIVGRH